MYAFFTVSLVVKKTSKLLFRRDDFKICDVIADREADFARFIYKQNNAAKLLIQKKNDRR